MEDQIPYKSRAKLSGKIYWVNDPFTYLGNYIAKTGDRSTHSVAKITDCIMDEKGITFQTIYKERKRKYKYSVALLLNHKQELYSGSASINGFITDIKISCEMFSGKGKTLLFGKWKENKVHYTWWAIIND